MDTLEIAAKMVLDATDTIATKFSAHVKEEINTKVSSLYKPGGSATLATLPALTAENSGYVYDMAEAFTTTANFREGAGHAYPAGTNVVVSDVGGDTYKYDVLSGMLDGYVKDTRKVGNVPLSADIPVSLTGDTAISVTNTGTASAIGYSITLTDSGVTAGSKGDASAQTPGFGGTFKALSATVDAKGRLTALNEHNVKIPNATATTAANGLMSGTDKSKLDGISADMNAVKALLRNAVLYRTASGNPATFSDGAAANVRDLTVTITPTQSGSGDPSPSNVRPISGVSSVTVTRTGQNGANSQSVTVALSDGASPLTVYGGTLDVTTGTLSVTQVAVSPSASSDVSVAADSLSSYGAKRFYFYHNIAAAPNVVSNVLKYSYKWDIPLYACYHEVGRGRIIFGLPQETADNAADAKQWLIDHNAQFVLTLETPVTYQLTPQQLATLAGYNSVSADSGSVTVEYRADVALSLDALESNLTNAILSLGAGF